MRPLFMFYLYTVQSVHTTMTKWKKLKNIFYDKTKDHISVSTHKIQFVCCFIRKKSDSISTWRLTNKSFFIIFLVNCIMGRFHRWIRKIRRNRKEKNLLPVGWTAFNYFITIFFSLKFIYFFVLYFCTKFTCICFIEISKIINRCTKCKRKK